MNELALLIIILKPSAQLKHEHPQILTEVTDCQLLQMELSPNVKQKHSQIFTGLKDGQLLQMEVVSQNFVMNIVTNIYGSEGSSIVTNGGGIRNFFMNIVKNIHRIEGWSIVTNGGGIRNSFYEYCYKYSPD